MWRATIKGLVAHKLRLGLTGLAVVLGVAFVAGTLVLTDTLGHTFDQLFAQVSKGVAVTVRAKSNFGTDHGRISDSLLPTVTAVEGVERANGIVQGYAEVIGSDGKAVSTGGAPTFGVNWVNAPENPLTLRSGRAPRGPTEVAIDVGTAEKAKLKVGDRVEILFLGPPRHFTVVGLTGFGSADNLAGATISAFDTATAQDVLDSKGKFDAIDVAAAPGVSDIALRNRIASVLPSGVEAITGAKAAQENAQQVKDGLGFFKTALLVFAGIALFVGTFIIFNTFSIIVAQRTRELGLLRALGATGRQVTTSVLVEAVITGLVASAVGLGLGVLMAIGLQSLLKGFGISLPSSGLVFLPRTIWVSLLIGTVVTVVAAFSPARRAASIPPIAAMRDVPPPAASLRRRSIVGTIVTVIGLAELFVGLFGSVKTPINNVGLGVALIFVGVAMLAPLIARPLARAIGAPFAALFKLPGRLGRENAARNPRRTSSTASALMIGLALVAFTGIFAQSLKASVADLLDRTLKADYILSTSQFAGFTPDAAQAARGVQGVGIVSELRGGQDSQIKIDGKSHFPSGVDPATIDKVLNLELRPGSSLAGLQSGGIAIKGATADANNWKLGDRIPVRFPTGGVQELPLVAIFDANTFVGDYLLSIHTFEREFTQQLDQQVLIVAEPGASLTAVRGGIDEAMKPYPNVEVQDQAEFRQQQENQIDTLLGLITALLLLAIIIALVGIVNTLALSIFERTREIGLLRAVGMSRRQVRGMIRWEAVVIAVFGAVLGVALGIFFGWALVEALKDQGITVFAIPVGQLVIYVVLAGLAGILAAVWPARRAAKLDVLRAVTVE
jgi:putative ABC transport system permease protein